MLSERFGRIARLSLAIVALGVAGCTDTSELSSGNQDPYEDTNRKVHAFNKGLDKNLLKPTSEAYGGVVPQPVRKGISNAVTNINEPLAFINHALQGDFDDAGATFARFAVNTVFGFGGLLDIGTDAGIYERPTDFGETMAVWGVREGAYVELPVFGPSSERDVAGRVVDFAMNPTTYVLTPTQQQVLAGATVADIVNQRYEFASVINALLYESADSYSAARIAYLQNKAQALSGGVSEDDLEDPYAFE
ncbi:MlaA family lipoprotein [Algicella marina]|nr:VacJ family lipoprotein [Algicella marina]